MPGTSEGARKAALTNKKKYGEDFYKTIGSRSWKNPRSHKTGFALNPQLASEAGRKGGQQNKGKKYAQKEIPQEAPAVPETQEVGPGVSE